MEKGGLFGGGLCCLEHRKRPAKNEIDIRLPTRLVFSVDLRPGE